MTPLVFGACMGLSFALGAAFEWFYLRGREGER